METRRLGNTDLDLSLIGLGTWAIGGDGYDFGWGPQDDKESIQTILQGFEQGINWVDTAPIYGIGHSEEVVGRAIAEWGEQVVLATKCGLIGDEKGHISPRITRQSIREEVEASLRRLKIDVIDLYQIHWPNPEKNIVEAWETMLALKKEGKIRWAGVSNFSASQLETISALGPVSSLQPPYSLLDRGIEVDTLPGCRDHNVGVIPYGTMQYGLLTGKVTEEWIQDLPESDWRKRKCPYFQKPKLGAAMELVEELKKVAEVHNRGVAELAIAWVLQQEGVTAAIVGARRLGQLLQTVGAAEWNLTSDILNAIDQAYMRYREQAES